MHKIAITSANYNGLKKYTTQYDIQSQSDSDGREAFRNLFGGLIACFFL